MLKVENQNEETNKNPKGKVKRLSRIKPGLELMKRNQPTDKLPYLGRDGRHTFGLIGSQTAGRSLKSVFASLVTRAMTCTVRRVVLSMVSSNTCHPSRWTMLNMELV